MTSGLIKILFTTYQQTEYLNLAKIKTVKIENLKNDDFSALEYIQEKEEIGGYQHVFYCPALKDVRLSACPSVVSVSASPYACLSVCCKQNISLFLQIHLNYVPRIWCEGNFCKGMVFYKQILFSVVFLKMHYKKSRPSIYVP